MESVKFLGRNDKIVKLDELDMWYRLNKDTALWLGIIAFEMLNLTVVWFAYDRYANGIMNLIGAGIAAIYCIYNAIWARRAKMLIKFAESAVQDNAENT